MRTEQNSVLARRRDFRLLWLGQGASAFGSSVANVAFPLLALALTHSPILVGVMALCGQLPFLLLQLHVGAYVDRWSRRSIMVAADAIRAAVIAWIVVALLLRVLSFAQLVGAEVVYGIGLLFFQTAEAAALPVIVTDEEELPSALGTNQARSYAARLAGPPVGGLLYGVAQFAPFVVDFFSYALSLVASLLIRTPLPAPKRDVGTTPSVLREIRAGLRVAWDHKFLRVTSLLSTGTDFVINGLFVMIVIVARERGSSALDIGLMSGMVSLGGVLGVGVVPLVRRLELSLRTVTLVVFWSGAPLVALMALSDNPFALGALMAVVMLVWPTYNAVIVGRWMAQIPNEQLGRVQAAAGVLGWAPVPLAPVVGTWLIQEFSPAIAMVTFACVVALVAVLATGSQAIRNESASASARAPAEPEPA